MHPPINIFTIQTGIQLRSKSISNRVPRISMYRTSMYVRYVYWYEIVFCWIMKIMRRLILCYDISARYIDHECGFSGFSKFIFWSIKKLFLDLKTRPSHPRAAVAAAWLGGSIFSDKITIEITGVGRIPNREFHE